MKILCNIEKLKKIIQLVGKITLKKDQNETLASIFFQFKKGELKIKGTNLNLGVEFTLPVETEDEGSFSILGQNIQQIFSSIQISKNEDTVELKIKDTILDVIYKKNKIKLKINNSVESPNLPFIKEQSFVIEKDILQKGIQSVVYSASKTDIKPELASIFINQQNGTLVFVTTDTFRLTEYKIESTKEYSFPSILLPAKNAQEIVKILEEVNTSSVEVYPSKNQISFFSKDVFITSQLINGVFPDYSKIIPTLKHSSALFLKTELLEVLKTVSNFTDIRNQIKITFNTENQEIGVFSENDTMGQYNGSISSKIVGDTVELLVNRQYLEEALNQLPENIEIVINQPTKPIILKSKQDTDILCLVMPMSK